MHDYFGIDEDIIWDVVSVRIPELKRHLDLMTNEMSQIDPHFFSEEPGAVYRLLKN